MSHGGGSSGGGSKGGGGTTSVAPWAELGPSGLPQGWPDQPSGYWPSGWPGTGPTPVAPATPTPTHSNPMPAPATPTPTHSNPIPAPVTPTPTGTPLAGGQPNVFNQSAGAYGDALSIMRGLRGYNEDNPHMGTYDPRFAQAAQIPGTSTYGAHTYSTAFAPDPDQISQGIQGYLNPYTRDVTDIALQDIDRSRQMAINQVSGDANAAGAFGGSRHGLVESETNRNAIDTAARTSAELNRSGWETAAGLSAQDIANQMQTGMFNAGNQNTARQFNAASRNEAGQFNNDWRNQIAMQNANYRQDTGQFNANAANQAGAFNAAAQAGWADNYFNRQFALANGLGGLSQQGYNYGTGLSGLQQQQGAQAQALLGSVLGQGGSMVDQFLAQPELLLNLRLASLGMNPGINTGTTTKTTETDPGLAGYLSLMFGGLGALKNW